jgi:hypothetical protein
MIATFESLGAKPVSYGFISRRKRKVPANVKVLKLERGGEPFALITDGDCRLLAVAARSGFGKLPQVLDVLSFDDRASPCSVMANCIGAGHVVAGHAAAEWMCREARLLTELRPHVQKVLGGGVS